MIIKNHTIELKDTSASEMARFRQIILGIWRQQIEDDKNSNEWEKLLKDHYATAKELDAKYANNSKKPDEITLKGDRYILNNEDHYQYTNASALEEVVVTASISPLVSILLWIKKNIGNKTQKLQLDSFPKNAPQNFNGIIKGYKISCNRQLLEAIVDLKNIEFKVSFPVKTFFLLNIFDLKKNLALRFETDSYEGLEYLAQFIGYDIETFKATITQQYKKAITEAGSDKDKLDIIYEDIPDFILASLKTDQQMYADIWTLLDQNVSDIGGRNEDQGILNILKTLQKKDAKKLFTKLYERPLWVMRLYETFSGEHRRSFVALIMDLCRYNKNKPEAKQQIYLPNGYWPSNLQLTANWSQNKIKFENTTTILNNLGKNLAYPTSGLFPSAVNEHKKIYEGAPLNPMDFITVKSIIEIDNDKKSTTEVASNQVALFIKYKVDELSQEAFWDVINVATTLAGGYGAIEVLTTQATGKLLKTLAVIELTKTIADLVMLTDRAKKALKEAGLGILVDNWTTISISADLSFLSLSLLITLAKYGRKGAKVLNDINETEHATHLEKQTEKAFTEIEKQTGVDVSKMSEKEFEKFYKKIEKKEKGNPEQYGEFIDTPENIPGKKLINQTKFTETPLGESKMSKLAIAHRKSLSVPKHRGNVAVFEFIDKNGATQYKAISTEMESTRHAEMLGMKWLNDNKIPFAKVKKIYSELEPCSLGQSKCKQVLEENFPNIEIEYSYKYKGTGGAQDTPEIKVSRANSREQRAKDLNKLIKD